MARKNKAQRRRDRKKPRIGRAQPHRIFLEGVDSYLCEYHELMKKSPIGHHVPVCEVGDDVWGQSEEEILRRTGYVGYEVVGYEADFEPVSVESRVGTACMITVKVPSGPVRPLIFVNNDLRTASGDPDIEAGIKILMLLHEYGHARDVLKAINFDHEKQTLDLVAAEVYAHTFVVRQCRKRGYRIALGYYLEYIESQARSAEESLRLTAERFVTETDVTELKAWIAEDYLSDPRSPYYREVDRRRRRGEL